MLGLTASRLDTKMFKKKKLEMPPSWLLRLEQLDRNLWNLNREVDEMSQKMSILKIVQSDMHKMDALTAMMSELARRVDLAGVADLPSMCVCESCGCNK